MLGEEIGFGLAASLVAALVSLAGLASMAALGDWGRRQSPYFSAFAVGVLTVAVGFHLAPEAIDYELNAWKAIVASFVGMTVVGFALRLFMGGIRVEESLAFGFASIVALGFHSFLDGVVYETTFHSDLYTGWVATIGLLLHEFPEGVIAYFLMRDAGFSTLVSTVTAAIASSLTTVFGALTAAYIIRDLADFPLGYLLGATAGALFYVIAFHLGPHARFARRPRGYLMAALGVIIATAAEIFRHSVDHLH